MAQALGETGEKFISLKRFSLVGLRAFPVPRLSSRNSFTYSAIRMIQNLLTCYNLILLSFNDHGVGSFMYAKCRDSAQFKTPGKM